MKKRIVLILILCFSFGSTIACTGVTTTTGTETTIGVLASPTNLNVNGTILSWSSVSNATGYIVYANGVQIASVTTNNYNFSTTYANPSIFTVVATANGYGNSAPSFGYSYAGYLAIEGSAINALFISKQMDVPSYIVNALVQNGMTAVKLTPIINEMQKTIDTISTAENDIAVINGAIRNFLATITEIEPMVATLVDILPTIINSEIINIDEMIEIYEDEMTGNELWDQYYQSMIDDLDEKKDRLITLQNILAENKTLLVQTMTAQVEYLISFHAAISDDLILDVIDMIESQTFNSSEILVIKNELIGMFEYNLPEISDLALLYDFIIVFIEGFSGETPMTVTLSSLTTELAIMEVKMMELMLAFLDTIDLAFLNELNSLYDTSPTELMFALEVQIMLIKYFNVFKDSNQIMFTDLENVLTLSQKTLLFNGLKDSIDDFISALTGDLETANIFAAIFEDLTYGLYSASSTAFNDFIDDAINHLSITNGELIRQIAISEAYYQEYDFWTDEYYFVNHLTGIEYVNYTEFLNAKEETNLYLLEQVVLFIDATYMHMSDLEVFAVIDMLLMMVPDSFLATELMITIIQTGALLDNADTTINALMPDLMDLLGNITDYIIASTLFDDLHTAKEEAIGYYKNNYGINYLEYLDNTNYEGFETDYYLDYAMAIVIAKHLNAFITISNEALIDGIIADIFTFLKTEEMILVLDTTLTDINNQELNIYSIFEDMIDYSNLIKGYQVSTLSPEQIIEVDYFVNLLR
jgi:hypothetical protein